MLRTVTLPHVSPSSWGASRVVLGGDERCSGWIRIQLHANPSEARREAAGGSTHTRAAQLQGSRSQLAEAMSTVDMPCTRKREKGCSRNYSATLFALVSIVPAMHCIVVTGTKDRRMRPPQAAAHAHCVASTSSAVIPGHQLLASNRPERSLPPERCPGSAAAGRSARFFAGFAAHALARAGSSADAASSLT
jgi:hypothetical protein